MLKPQTGSAVRKPPNGVPAAVSMSAAGRGRSSKPPSSPSVFEGVYNNARMTHFLTAVVGSTCDIRVKNGNVHEGIFKTLSSRCELVVDAVHRRGEEDSSSISPKREEITDTMIFNPVDIVTMTCRDVDLNFATRDTFTDTAISLSPVNGEHKEKVLQRWDGGDSNGESYDLDTEASNGWDANEMFRFNEENYGIKSTYDSSLSMYTFPLERNSSECYRQREARAVRLANEIESSPQYRHRVSLENDDGKSEEEKYSAVVRDGEREKGRESPRERERGRDSPSGVSREGKYIPLPQRAREMGASNRGGRGGSSYTTNRSTPPGSSPRLPLIFGWSQPPLSSERSSPRGGFSPNTSSPRLSEPSSVGSGSSLPTPNTHSHPFTTITHSHSLPHTLSDASRTINGVSSRTSPKSQKPSQTNRAARPSNTHPSASRSPKSDVPLQDASIPSSTSVDNLKQKYSGPAPLFPVDVNEILSSAGKEKPAETLPSTEESNSKAPSIQQRSQIEELRSFGNDFRLPSSGGSPNPPNVPSALTQETPSTTQPNSTKPNTQPASPVTDSKPSLNQSLIPSPQGQNAASALPAEDAKEKESSVPLADRQSPGMPQPARTPGSEDPRPDSTSAEAGTEQVKKSTLNPNAKEFNPIKPQMTLSKTSTVPTPPRPVPHSPSVFLQHGQNIYNTSYLGYVPQIHSVQAPQMYQYTMTTVNQGKYPRPPKGSVVAPRSDHNSTAPPMLQAAASAAGASIVTSPYGQSYLQCTPQQYGQQQVIQAMTPYAQPMYSVLQSGARMLGQGGGHPQALGPPTGAQFTGQPDVPQGPQQGLYAPQTFSHHSASVHPPQPSSTPTGNQPPQHTAPSPGQSGQTGPQPLYHSGPLSAPTPPTLLPGHSSPQTSYPLQGYSLHRHQPMPHTYPALSQLTQTHVPGPMTGPHHSGTHGPPQVVMLHAPPHQTGPGSAPQHPPHGPQQGPPQHYAYLHQVQVHPSQQIPFHPPGN
ncbi:ataxin-2-like protein [Xyrauchen texanus]|uniref:ataxin-2-like protein n=1 Tax=Xyrauchen texanus TaxID=154827 RepID=UPI002241A77D|nr:ataxin-2-like protein [Xyrauchen texanus]